MSSKRDSLELENIKLHQKIIESEIIKEITELKSEIAKLNAFLKGFLTALLGIGVAIAGYLLQVFKPIPSTESI